MTVFEFMPNVAVKLAHVALIEYYDDHLIVTFASGATRIFHYKSHAEALCVYKQAVEALASV